MYRMVLAALVATVLAAVLTKIRPHLIRPPRILVSALVLPAMLAFGQLAGASGTQIAPGPPVTFTDPSGDSGTAPDITTVLVSNDANGRIDFQIDVPGQPGLRPDCLLFLVMDTDNNPATGAPNTEGGDYYIAMYG